MELELEIIKIDTCVSDKGTRIRYTLEPVDRTLRRVVRLTVVSTEELDARKKIGVPPERGDRVLYRRIKVNRQGKIDVQGAEEGR